MISIKELVAAMQPSDDELRDDGSIAGCVGEITADLTVRLPVAKLTKQARFAMRELLDSGVVVSDARGRLCIAKRPEPTERRLIRQALGLDRKTDEETK
jgi:hypothetical protein